MISFTRAGSPLAEAPIVTSASAGRGSRASSASSVLPPTLKPTSTARSSPSARRTWSVSSPKRTIAELLALVGRAAVAAEVDDDRAVARREPLRDLAPVEGARARAAVEEDDRDAAATLADGDPPTRDGDAQHAAPAIPAIDR